MSRQWNYDIARQKQTQEIRERWRKARESSPRTPLTGARFVPPTGKKNDRAVRSPTNVLPSKQGKSLTSLPVAKEANCMHPLAKVKDITSSPRPQKGVFQCVKKTLLEVKNATARIEAIQNKFGEVSKERQIEKKLAEMKIEEILERSVRSKSTSEEYEDSVQVAPGATFVKASPVSNTDDLHGKIRSLVDSYEDKSVTISMMGQRQTEDQMTRGTSITSQYVGSICQDMGLIVSGGGEGMGSTTVCCSSEITTMKIIEN